MRVRLSYAALGAKCLIGLFLTTSIFLPLCYRIGSTESIQEKVCLSTSDDTPSQSAQFPLAENEKEEKDEDEKDTEYFFECSVGRDLYTIVHPNKNIQIDAHRSKVQITREFPLYLRKMALLI